MTAESLREVAESIVPIVSVSELYEATRSRYASFPEILKLPVPSLSYLGLTVALLERDLKVQKVMVQILEAGRERQA